MADKKKKYDFSGYVTKNDIKCSDGRVIRHGAFSADNGKTVPLVWQHLIQQPSNILGQILLEERDDGMYGYAVFNHTENGSLAKELVHSHNLDSLSIHATDAIQRGSDVIKGVIKEVSLVISGANPGAKIDNVVISHSDGTITELDDEIILYPNIPIEFAHSDDNNDDSTEDDSSLESIIGEMSKDEQEILYQALGSALGKEPEEISHSDESEGGSVVKKNVFDTFGSNTTASDKGNPAGITFTHDDFTKIMDIAKDTGSLKQAVIQHAAASYGIENIDYLFPDARLLRRTPDMIMREQEWVNKVVNGANHSPFSRIKSMAADITADEARAKGYVKGNYKKEEVIRLLKRVTTPTTIYKKQRLDREDIVSITDFDVVQWLWQEMRVMLKEELARAILVSDGRDPEDQDKVKEENIRPIWKDEEMYAIHVPLKKNYTPEDLIETVIRSKSDYKGTGNPSFFTSEKQIIDMLLIKDETGRKIYRSEGELSTELRVSELVPVPVMENLTREDADGKKWDLVGIMVNMRDYTIGTDKGGEISPFSDFDIDYNQYKYLLETMCSGTLTLPASAIIFEVEHDAEAALKVLKVSADPANKERYGVKVGDMQENIDVGSYSIRGHLPYKTNTFSGGWTDPKYKDGGNFLSLNMEADVSGATIKTKVIGGDSEEKTVSDGFCMYLIKDPKKQVIQITAEKNGTKIVKMYDLSGLTLGKR